MNKELANTLHEFFFDLPHAQSKSVAMQIYEDQTPTQITYVQLVKQIKQAAALLQEIGIKPGSRVILLSENRPEAMLAFFAVVAAKATVVLLDPQLPSAELEKLLDVIEPCALLISQQYIALGKLAIKRGLIVKNIQQDFLSANNPNFINYDTMAEETPIAAIMFSSGTAGSPKGVMLTHKNFLTAMTNAARIELVASDNMLTLLPVHHISALIQNLISLCTGATLTFVAKLDSQTIMATLQASQPTIIGIVPLMLELFCQNIQAGIKKQPVFRQKLVPLLAYASRKTKHLTALNAGFYLFPSIRKVFGNKLRQIICGGAAANPATVAIMSSYGFIIIEAYGLTEVTGPICAIRANALYPGRVGLPFNKTNFRIVNRNQQGWGEICIKGDMVMHGYFRDLETSRQVIKDGWLHTGDIGYLDKKGRLYITGRKKEMIVLASGKTIPFAVIEAQYKDIVGIAELVVFSRLNTKKNAEEIHAAIVLNADLKTQIQTGQRSLPEINNYIETKVHERASGLAAFLQIQQVHLLDSLPKTAMLKVQRALLPELIRASNPHTLPNAKILNVVPKELSPKAIEIKSFIETWITDNSLIPATELDAHKSFIYFGLDSLSVSRLCLDLQNWLNIEVSPILIWEHSSIAKLSSHLANQLNVGCDLGPTPPLNVDGDLGPTSQPDDPIVIVGMACRLPGGINYPEDFWEVLMKGQNVISEVPKFRWDNTEYYDAAIDSPGKINSRWGGFIDGVDQFDSAFFKISPLEAENMDPQQRLLLEVAWEALERSGCDPSSLVETKAGVYVGISTSDYAVLQIEQQDLQKINAYYGIGNSLSAAASRIAYFLGLRGVAKSMDTACSSSLVAVHDACRDLHNGETSLAIVGGVNVILAPINSVSFSKAKMLAPDGVCKVFDAKANGYVRSEGCGVVILKRLSDAKKNGDAILASIAGIGVNQDGYSNGLTAPNGEAQMQLFASVLRQANLSSNEISYIETHGTGTPLGDPIETNALAKVYAPTRTSSNPLYLGSVKSNIGHLESAAGIASLIKTVLVLQAQKIPLQINFNNLNPLIKLDGLTIPRQTVQWKSDAPRYAAVNAFGFTGTNAHIILGEALEDIRSPTPAVKPYYFIPLSAKTDEALKQRVIDLATWLKNNISAALENISYTLSVGRTHFKNRCFFVVDAITSLQQALDQWHTATAIDKPTVPINETTFNEVISLLAQPQANDNYREQLILLGGFYVAGHSIPWQAIFPDSGYRKLVLPTYPFSKERHWLGVKKPEKFTQNMCQPLLDQEIITPFKGHCFTTQLNLQIKTHEYFNAHIIVGKIIYPAAGFLELMLQAIRQVSPTKSFYLANVVIEAPLELHPQEPAQIYVRIEPQDALKIIKVYRRVQNEWLCHAHAEVKYDAFSPPTTIDLDALKNKIVTKLNPEQCYLQFKHFGFEYQASFQTIVDLWHHDTEILAHIAPKIAIAHYLCHPTMLDACFQALLATLFNVMQQEEIYLPISVKTFYLYKPFTENIWVHGERFVQSANTFSGRLSIMDAAGELLAELHDCIVLKTNKNSILKALTQQTDLYSWLYTVSWQQTTTIQNAPSATLGATKNTSNWIMIGDANTSALCSLLSLHFAHAEIKANIILMRGDESDHKEISAAVSQQLNGYDGGIIYLSEDYKGLLYLQEFFTVCKWWLVTRGAYSVKGEVPMGFAQQSLWSMQKSLQIENPHFKCSCIDLDAESPLAEQAAMLFAQLMHPDNEDQIAFRQDERWVPRLIPSTQIQEEKLSLPKDGHYQLVASATHLIKDLAFAVYPPRSLAPDEIEIEIKATAINFRDTLTALGLYPGNPPLGIDCAAIVTAVGEQVTQFHPGDAVFGMVQGCFANRVITAAVNVAHKPSHLSFAQAAALPTVFLTAYYAFKHLITLKPGQRVLIHTASGGLGLAAIQLAKLAGAEIFATAGSDKKRAHLHALGIQHVFNSRTLEYGPLIAAATNNAGVEVVLNTLTGPDYIATTLAVCGKGAHFLEVSKRNIWTKEQMQDSRPDINYHIIALDDVAIQDPKFIQHMYLDLSALFESKKLWPLPLKIYPYRLAKTAFQDMCQAKHIGKLVLTPQVQAESLNTDGLHVITGGLGALGLAVTQWMLEQGVRDLILVNRKAANAAALQQLAELMTRYPTAKIQTYAADIADFRQTETLFAFIADQLLPLRGIIHAAGVLDDALMVNQSVEKYERVLAPKVKGAWHLHELSKALDLDYFVLFSSVVSLLGSPGQSNYAAANGYLDGLAHYRRSQGLKAQSINWGAWNNLGMANKLLLNSNYGIGVIELNQGLAALNLVLHRSNYTQVAVLPMNWSKYFQHFANKPYFNEIKAKLASDISKEKLTLAKLLKNRSELEQNDIIKEYLKNMIKQILKLNDTYIINDDTKFAELGIDSLTGMEFKSQLEAELNGSSFAQEFSFENATIQTITSEVIKILHPALPLQPIKDPAPVALNTMLADSSAEKEEVKLSEADLTEIRKRVDKILHPGVLGRLRKKCINSLMFMSFRIYFRLEVQNKENLPTATPFILCGNHTSVLDGLVLLLAGSYYKNGCVPLIAEKHFNPFQRLLALFIDAVPFDRGTSDYAFLKNNTYITLLKESGKSFIMFPESTRSENGEIQEFKHGVSWFAHKEALQVVPSYIHGAFQSLPKGGRYPKPKKLVISIGKALTPETQKNDIRKDGNLAVHQSFTSELRESILKLARMKMNKT